MGSCSSVVGSSDIDCDKRHECTTYTHGKIHSRLLLNKWVLMIIELRIRDYRMSVVQDWIGNTRVRDA